MYNRISVSGSASKGDNIVAYIWDWGDGTNSTSTGASTTKIYTNPGIYDVSLTIVDKDGLTSTITKTKIVTLTDSIYSFVGDVDSFENNSTSGWTTVGNTVIINVTESSYNPASDGSWYVRINPGGYIVKEIGC